MSVIAIIGAEVQQERALAGLDQFRDGGVVPELGVDVDTDQLYASGYCAGAIYASELARLNAGVQAVALFHANYQNLSAFTPAMSDVWMQYQSCVESKFQAPHAIDANINSLVDFHTGTTTPSTTASATTASSRSRRTSPAPACRSGRR